MILWIKNKNYFDVLQKEIKVGELTLTKGQAITLYLTSLREQGRSHLYNEGDGSGVIHLNDNKSVLKGNFREAFVKGKDVKNYNF